MERIRIKNPSLIDSGDNDVVVHVASYADVSDGYHTIEELYDHRITLYIALCRKLQEWVYPPGARNEISDGYDKTVWRSKLHHDGTGYDGWFLLAVGREAGKQITYHIPLSRWEETNFAQTYEKAPVKFDGHTSADVIERLKAL